MSTETDMRSPPVRPPAELMSTACGGWPAATLGSLILAAPDWNRLSSRVRPSACLKAMRAAPFVLCSRPGVAAIASKGEMTANGLFIQVRGASREDDLATFHDRDGVRKRAGKIQ